MLFSSMTFVFMFLPLVFTAYLLMPARFRNILLLAASVLFYAWGEPRYVAIMLLTVLINWLGALLIVRFQKHKTFILTASIITDLSFLFYFKYYNFVAVNINAFAGADIPLLKVIMPIGISFYTFQAMSYLIDVYRGKVRAQSDVFRLALYITLFPQLVAGPIVKYHDMAEQLSRRSITPDKVLYGVRRFIIGLAKKVLIANTLGIVADAIFAQPVANFDVLTAWAGALAYSLQLFYDFSGYSDMAIGLGAMFGFKFLENFNYPYISKSISEFWQRWHISLSSWFKEYLYIPLGGNRNGTARMVFNLALVFLATGIWHGAEWTFVAWGVWHGAFVILEKLSGWHKTSRFKLLHHTYCLLVLLVGWVIFRAENLTYAYAYLQNMFGLLSSHNITNEIGAYVDNFELIVFAVAIICALPLFKNMVAVKSLWADLAVNIWLLILFMLSTAALASSTYNPFIYFRF